MEELWSPERKGGGAMGASLVEGVIMGDMVKSLRGISFLDLSGFGIKPSRPSAAAASIQLPGLTALTRFLFFPLRTRCDGVCRGAG